MCYNVTAFNVTQTKAKQLKDRTGQFKYDSELDGWNSTVGIYVNGIPLGTDSGSLSFNTTNLPVSLGTVNTAQGISSVATPTFAGLTINGNIAVSGTVDGINISSFVGLFDNLDGIISRDNDTGIYSVVEPDNWDLAYQHKLTVDTINGIIKCNGSGTYSAITDNSTAWNGLVTWQDNLDANDGIITVNGGVYNRIADNSDNWNWVYEQSGSFLTGESDTLQDVSGRGNSTTEDISAKSFTGSITATNHTLRLPVDNDTSSATGSAWIRDNDDTLIIKSSTSPSVFSAGSYVMASMVKSITGLFLQPGSWYTTKSKVPLFYCNSDVYGKGVQVVKVCAEKDNATLSDYDIKLWEQSNDGDSSPSIITTLHLGTGYISTESPDNDGNVDRGKSIYLEFDNDANNYIKSLKVTVYYLNK